MSIFLFSHAPIYSSSRTLRAYSKGAIFKNGIRPNQPQGSSLTLLAPMHFANTNRISSCTIQGWISFSCKYYCYLLIHSISIRVFILSPATT